MKSEMSRSRLRSEQRRRNFVIRVRVDGFELDLIRELAASLAVSVSSYVRDAALKRAIKGNTTRRGQSSYQTWHRLSAT